MEPPRRLFGDAKHNRWVDGLYQCYVALTTGACRPGGGRHGFIGRRAAKKQQHMTEPMSNVLYEKMLARFVDATLAARIPAPSAASLSLSLSWPQHNRAFFFFFPFLVPCQREQGVEYTDA